MAFKSYAGYMLVYVGNKKYTPEHVLIMEKHLGRKLIKNEIVHHIDESFEGRSNNHISNLKVMTRSEHQFHHGTTRGTGNGFYVGFDKGLKCPWRLRIRNTKEKGIKWLSIGRYISKEEAINRGVEYVASHVSE